MYLPISRQPRKKNRGKASGVKAKRAAKNRRRIQGMRGKARGRRLARKW